MSAQTSYAIRQTVAVAGALYALHNTDINSFAVEPAAGVEFAVAVKRGADPEKQIDLAGSANAIGVTIRSIDREGLADGSIKYAQNETAGVLSRGYVWAVCPSGCTAGDAVKYTNDTGVLDAGAAGAGETQLDGAEWYTTAAAGELAVVKLSNMNQTAGS